MRQSGKIESAGWGRYVVCSGQYDSLSLSLSLSLSTVASACPFVIYVCFMARRIRKRLIKDSRVAAHELLARRRAWPPRNIVSPFRRATCKHLVIMDLSVVSTCTAHEEINHRMLKLISSCTVSFKISESIREDFFSFLYFTQLLAWI